MGYLQVRDFPEDLHGELKLLAKNEHRSVSQQTIIAIKEHVAHAAERDKANQVNNAGGPFKSRGTTDYLDKRMKVFERIAATPKPFLDLKSEDIVRAIHEGRAELDDRVRL